MQDLEHREKLLPSDTAESGLFKFIIRAKSIEWTIDLTVFMGAFNI